MPSTAPSPSKNEKKAKIWTYFKKNAKNIKYFFRV
jgi:hypothetical protein